MNRTLATLRKSEARLKPLARRLAKWESRFDAASFDTPQGKRTRAVATKHCAAIRKQMFPLKVSIANAQRRLRRKQEKEMRRGVEDDHPHTVLAQAPAGFKRVWDQTRTVGDKTCARGSDVDMAALAETNNGAYLLERCTKLVPINPKPVLLKPIASAPKPPAAPTVDHVAVARRALDDVVRRRGGCRRDWVDIIDRDVLKRAITMIAETPRMAQVGSWGGGGGSMQQVGKGTLRRPVDDALSIICDGHEPEVAA